MSVDATSVQLEPEQRSRPRRRRREWRRGGSSTRRWGKDLLGISLASLGLALIAVTLVARWASPAGAGIFTGLALWTILLVPIVLGFRRSVPRGLLRFRATDLLWGLMLGVTLRLLQGGVEWLTFGVPPVFPSYPTLDGTLPVPTLINDVVVSVAIGPVVEEFFFRGLLLVTIFTVGRRAWGPLVGGYLAVVGTTTLFVLSHALVTPTAPHVAIALALVGTTCGLLVILTGRIWAAVLVHISYNGLYVVLTTAGTISA